MTLMTPEALNAFFDREFPQLTSAGARTILVESVGPMVGTVRLVHHDRNLRPGGTISGPAMFALADVALYATILAQIGPIGLAVTTNMTINFMRKPSPGDLVARCRLMKLGRQLAVGEATLLSEGSDDIVAHAMGTYAIPPATVVA
jgi:uncharacterized protein (TIGR00369 family)